MTPIIGFINRIDGLLQGHIFLAMMIKAAMALIFCLLSWIVIKSSLKMAVIRLQTVSWVRLNTQLLAMVTRAAGLGLLLLLGSYLIRLFHLSLAEKPFHAVFVLLLAAPIKGFFLIILNYLEQRWADKTETKIDDIIFDLLNRFSGAVIYAVAAVAALDIMGINVMPFIAGAGVLGIAIGFAAKDTLSNLIAGVLLIIDRPFEIGDRIEVWSAPAGSSSWGDVIDIGLRATKIKTTDNIIIVIPNNEIMKRDIVNYTLISSDIRVRINIGVSYDTDIKQAKEVILQVADQVQWVLKNPPPRVVVRSFGESAVDLQLRVWITDARRRMDTISEITDRVKNAFDSAGIEIPYPKRDIHIFQTN
jgi:small-conductance mechanosensitive channel